MVYQIELVDKQGIKNLKEKTIETDKFDTIYINNIDTIEKPLKKNLEINKRSYNWKGYILISIVNILILLLILKKVQSGRKHM